MNSIVMLCAFSVISAILSLIIKKYNQEIAFALALCACVLILIFAITTAIQAYTTINSIIESYSINTEFFIIVFKAFGICFLTEFAYDCCKDAEQNALAGNTLLAGKICVLITALPLFENILNLSASLIRG